MLHGEHVTAVETLLERLLSHVPVGVRTNPFEAWLAFLGVLSGLVYLTGVAQSTALSESLPLWATRVWGAVMMLACVCLIRGLLLMVDNQGIVSMLGRGVAVYKLGLRLLAGVCVVYGTAVMFKAHTNGLAAALPYWSLSAAAVLRLLIIRVSSARTPGWRR